MPVRACVCLLVVCVCTLLCLYVCECAVVCLSFTQGSQQFVKISGEKNVVYVDPIGAALTAVYIFASWWNTGAGDYPYFRLSRLSFSLFDTLCVCWFACTPH